MSSVNRQTLDASNAHQIRQLDMWKDVTIMHRRRRRWTYASRNHDNKRELMNKLLNDDFFARSTRRQCSSQNEEKVKTLKLRQETWYSLYLREDHCLHSLNRIHHEVSQQINAISLRRALDYLAKSTFLAVSFTFLRNKNINKLTSTLHEYSSQKN
jgi:hypothetical protein